MGGADFINVLYSEFLTYDPDQPTWETRDRFFLDPGHMSPMLYSPCVLLSPPKHCMPARVTQASSVRRFMPTSAMAVCRKKYLKVLDVWLATWDWTT